MKRLKKYYEECLAKTVTIETHHLISRPFKRAVLKTERNSWNVQHTYEYVRPSVNVQPFASVSWRAIHVIFVVHFKGTLIEIPTISQE